MIYITGDTHGDIDRFKKFKKLFPKYKNHIFVCGDFGFVWNGSDQEKEQIKKLEKYDCVIMFVEGTHDNLDLLSQYPEEEYCGGRVKRLSPNMLWMQRGEIYEIEGQKVFALGGGESHDADEREAGVNWWPDELPSVAELEYARCDNRGFLHEYRTCCHLENDNEYEPHRIGGGVHIVSPFDDRYKLNAHYRSQNKRSNRCHNAACFVDNVPQNAALIGFGSLQYERLQISGCA